MFAKNDRRFGVELEYNAFDRQSRSKSDNELPAGIYDLANSLLKSTNMSVEVNRWGYTNNNERWVLKPDSSCGIEICSPPMRGKKGCLDFYEILKIFVNNSNLESDERCSMHVHFEIEDFSTTEIANLIDKWINCEPLFFLLTASDRWLNQYCIPLGISHNFDNENPLSVFTALDKLSEYKYYAINLYHYVKNRKKTIEFRCMGGDACVIPEDAFNWIKILMCFVERCKGNKLLDPINPEYKSILETINFLNIQEFFDDNDEIILWIISKLSRVLHEDIKDVYYWKSFVNFSRFDILDTIEKLEADLV
jgi:hypothetical protein